MTCQDMDFEGVRWFLAPGCDIVGPLGPVCCGVRPPWIRPVQHILKMLDQIGIWGMWRPGRHLGPFIVFLELFLSSVCSVSGHIILLGGPLPWVVLL